MRKRIRMAARRALAILLTLLLVASPPLQSAALAEGSESGPYLKEVYVGVAKTAKKAAEALETDGWTVLKANGEPADLNKGANAALKSNRAVVLGYKTTDNAAEGITDLSVMNMNGGYSFSNYADLMDKYRDSQIRPFIDRFMATVNEYRANAASDNEGNRARADMARTLLNRIIEDDTEKRMGDLLLEQTKAELGDAYESMSTDEQKQHIDLEVALMQGDSSVVLTAEKLLALAADSNETTWLERLSELGPDGLAASMGYARPADAESELASRYQDLAIQLAEGWNDMRARLLAQDEGEDADDEERADETVAGEDQSTGDEQEENDLEDDAIVVEAEAEDDGIVVEDEGEEPLVLEGETEAPVALAPAVTEVVELEGDDEVDLAELVTLEPPEEMEADDDEVAVEDAPEIIVNACDTIGDMTDSGKAINDTRETAIATYLRTLPYGDGTLYDLFTRPAAEVTGSNISALYPAASCLSEGQAAAIEFLSLADLLQAGSTTGDALAEVWIDATGLKANAEAAPDVSLYEGVDRSIFTKLTALTSEAMRADALRSQDTGVIDVLSTYRRSALLWTGTAITGIVAAASAYFNSSKATVQTVPKLTTELSNAKKSIEETIKKADKIGLNTEKWRGGTLRITNEGFVGGKQTYRIDYTPKHPYNTSGMYKDYDVRSIFVKGKTGNTINIQKNGSAVEVFKDNYNHIKEMELNDQIIAWNKSNTSSIEVTDVDLVPGRHEYSGNVDDYIADKVDDYIETVEKPIQKPSNASKWGTVARVASVVFFLITVASIISTAIDVYQYYNVDYAPVPGYMVDVSDITSVADDGTTTVIRNDTAYYKVARTNVQRDGEDLVAMLDYADLNGDAGKEWVALYTASRDGQAPILADSLKVVTGTNSMPDGYGTGIHEFGSDAAANLTDARYCYNDDANGVYAYFRRDEGMATAAASAFGSGSAALWAAAGLAVGAVGGAGVTAFAGRRRREAFA